MGYRKIIYYVQMIERGGEVEERKREKYRE